jgi:hypothetical protein
MSLFSVSIVTSSARKFDLEEGMEPRSRARIKSLGGSCSIIVVDSRVTNEATE